VGERFALKAARAAELGAPHASPGVDLVGQDYELGLVIFNQIPGVGRELVLEVCQEPAGTVQTDTPVAAQTHSQQVIESREMIHVSVRYEYVADAQQLARRQDPDVADVEEDRAAFEFEVDIDPGIAEAPVDEL